MIPSNISKLDLQSFSVSFPKKGNHSFSQEKVSAVSLKNLSSQCLRSNSASLENRVAKFCIKEILAAKEMILKNKLASWESLDKTVDLYYRDGSLQADVISKDAKTTIPFYDIEGLPVELNDKPEFLPFFLNDSYIRLSVLDDGSLKLYISSRLHGGGRWTAFLSLVAVGGGLIGIGGAVGFMLGAKALTLARLGATAIIGTVLVGAGIKQIIDDIKHLEPKVNQNENISSKLPKNEEQGKDSDAGSAAGGASNAADEIDQKFKASDSLEKAENEVSLIESKRLDPVMPGVVSREERIKLGSIRQNDLERLMEFYLSKKTDSVDDEEHPFGPMPSKPKKE